jgi:iron complex outermembrane receptor protein
VNATHLDEYLESTANADNTVSVTDRTGQHTNETFQRAFAEWRAVTTIDWTRERWTGALVFRWTDEMIFEGAKLDSAMFTDLRVTYNPSYRDDALSITLGFNNVLDEDPPPCTTCGVGMSRVAHDIPGTVGYLRVTYRHE